MNKNELITSVHNPRIQELLTIQARQTKADSVQFLVEGNHLVELAQAAGCLVAVYSLTPYPFQNTTRISENVLKKLSNNLSAIGPIGLCNKPEAQNNLDITTNYIYLDGIQDPGNLGTIVRSALAFGYNHIVLSPECASVYNPKTLRSMQGANFGVQTQVMEQKEFINRVAERPIYLSLVDPQAEKLTNITRISPGHILVFGSEGQGISPAFIDLGSRAQRLFIDIQGIESLNVSVAAGIIMHHFYHASVK